MGTMNSAAPTPRRRRRRPFTLIILAALLLLKAVLVFAVVAGTLADETGPLASTLRIPGLTDQIRAAPGAGLVLILIAAILVASAVGLLLDQRAGWLLAMVTTGLFIAMDIVGFFDGNVNHLWMVLNIVTVFYLNQRDVREGVAAAPPAADAMGAR